MRVLICGGRDYNDWQEFCWGLAGLLKVDSKIIHGGCTGADSLAAKYAEAYGHTQIVYRANWSEYGKSAGPKRNQLMLDDGKPDLVVAFPGGRGTADMVRRAKKAVVKVIEIGKGEEESKR